MRRINSHVELGPWSANFEPRDIDIAGADIVVLVEVWERNDYRVDLENGLTGTVLDIGANIGAFTVLASLAGAERVVAVEPQPDNFKRLCHHVASNDLVNEVRLINAAVAPPGISNVDMIGVGGGARSIPGGPIPTVDLHDLIDEFAPISMMKMDIEGGEYPIFAALDVRQLAYVERISMEWHGPASPHLAHLRGDEFGGLVSKLADAGAVETFGHPRSGGILHWRKY